jgi:hypothetical protein
LPVATETFGFIVDAGDNRLTSYREDYISDLVRPQISGVVGLGAENP